MKKRLGFTLIELLIVVGVLATLSTVVFVALNPAQRFLDARNSRRVTDVNSILTAIHQCIVDNGGSLTACGIADTTKHTLGTDAGNLNLSTYLAPYLKKMPQDPSTGSLLDTGYAIQADANNLITVFADDAEGGELIEASR